MASELVKSDVAAGATNTLRPLTHSLDSTKEGLAMDATRACCIEGCDRPISSRQMCVMHVTRWRRTGDPGEASPRQRKSSNEVCIVDHCDGPDHRSGYCVMHYTRIRRHGDPHVVIPVSQRNLPRGPRNHSWMGDAVGYQGAHERIYSQRGRAANFRCVDCWRRAAHWSYDYMDPNHRFEPNKGHYSLDVTRYAPRCGSCHKKFDLAHEPPLCFDCSSKETP